MLLVFYTRVSCLTQQYLTHLQVTMTVCNMETSLAYLIHHLVKLCVPAQQQTHHPNMASQRGKVARLPQSSNSIMGLLRTVGVKTLIYNDLNPLDM